MRRIVAVILTSAMSLMLASCVSPFYGTARIEQGFHMDAGVSAMSYIGAYGEWHAPSVGGVASIAPSYGFNPYLQLGGRLDLGYGQTGYLVQDTAGNLHNPWRFIPDLGICLHASLPFKTITPAVRAEGTLSGNVSLAVLIGIGQPERLTFGIRGGRNGLDILAIVRPLQRFSVFLGLDPFGFVGDNNWPVISLGLGYKFF